MMPHSLASKSTEERPSGHDPRARRNSGGTYDLAARLLVSPPDPGESSKLLHTNGSHFPDSSFAPETSEPIVGLRAAEMESGSLCESMMYASPDSIIANFAAYRLLAKLK